MSLPIRFGYRAVAEQYPPSKLLEFAGAAERAGFEFVSVSDHFHPWFHEGGHAAFAWSWIAAAAARTETIRFGTGVSTPINRYHPAIIAQAFATMDEMFPGRVFVGIGTGEAMNEVPIGQNWPPFRERVRRIEESIQIMRRLWAGEFVTYSGHHFSVRDAKIYDTPAVGVPIYLAASGPTTARLAGRVADGFYTTPMRDEKLRDSIWPALESGAREAGRDVANLSKMTLCNISWDPDYDKALRSILRWRAVAVHGSFGQNVWDPRVLDEQAKSVPVEDLAWRWTICTGMEDVLKAVERYVRLGFDEIEIRSGSPDEHSFIQKFSTDALPYLVERHGSGRR